eukprot:SM000067S20342  [mRNA]  locus=s67:480674:484353:- [translate_table: standard]
MRSTEIAIMGNTAANGQSPRARASTLQPFVAKPIKREADASAAATAAGAKSLAKPQRAAEVVHGVFGKIALIRRGDEEDEAALELVRRELDAKYPAGAAAAAGAAESDSTSSGRRGRGMDSESDEGGAVVEAGPQMCWESFLPQRHLKVLLVEDDDSTRHVVGALLRNCNYEVIPASNGQQALELLEDRNNWFDLVLTDVVMPGLSGIALLTKIMQLDISRRVPVIMMSSLDSIDMVLKCLQKGASDFLVKPVRKNELKNLWQHVWRKCNSSSGSGSGSGTSGFMGEDIPQDLPAGDAIVGEDLRKDSPQSHSPTPTSSPSPNERPSTSGAGRSEACMDGDKEREQDNEEEDDDVDEDGDDGAQDDDGSGGSTSILAADLIGAMANKPIKQQGGGGGGGGGRGGGGGGSGRASGGSNDAKSPLGSNSGKDEADLDDRCDAEGNEVLDRGGSNSPKMKSSGDEDDGEHLPLLELTLKRPRESEEEQQEERRVLHQSGGSAFSRYSTSGVLTQQQSPYPHNGGGHNQEISSPRREPGPMYAGQAPLEDEGSDDPGNGGAGGLPVVALPPGMHGFKGHVSPPYGVHPLFYQRGVGGPPSIGSPVVGRLDAESGGCKSGSPWGNGHTVTASDSGVGVVGPAHNRLARREAALTKFRQKRTERCFEKKVRYQSRKRLAEQRPRVRGQFVRQSASEAAVLIPEQAR